MKIVTEIFNEDETRMLRVLISETTFEVKIKEAESQKFNSNIGPPQGDSISGPLFTLYFEKALRKLEQQIQSEPIDVNDINKQWLEPAEMIYADDCDVITENCKKKQTTYKKAKELLTENNLLINDEKTEKTQL